MENLIASIDDILRGENKMDFAVFNKSEIEELCQTTIDRMPEFMRESIIREFGGIESWREHYIERTSREDIQKGYQKLVEWYGDKESALKSMNNPPGKEVAAACLNRVESILDKLIQKKEEPLDSLAVKQLVGEYGFVMKQFLQMKHEEGAMLSLASSYRDPIQKTALDEKYGDGAAEFFAQAIEVFYQK